MPSTQVPPFWQGLLRHCSQASPSESPSALAWSVLGTEGQLSQPSGMVSLSLSVELPAQVPLVHMSLVVQGSPSLHAVPSASGV